MDPDIIKRWIKRLPPVRGYLRRRYDRQFRHQNPANLFRGVYATFADALAAAPPTKPSGYDNPAAASMYGRFEAGPNPADYAVLYWLQRICVQGARIFDFGGHVGIKYYAFAGYLSDHDSVDWRVCDVPAVVERGRELAEQRGAERLTFTTNFAECDGYGILLSLGSLQYIEEPLAQKLAVLAHPPEHVLVNSTPMYDGDDFVTLNSMGIAFCPYKVRNRRKFVSEMEAAGYELADSWEVPGKACVLPDPDHTVRDYQGFYFRRS